MTFRIGRTFRELWYWTEWRKDTPQMKVTIGICRDRTGGGAAQKPDTVSVLATADLRYLFEELSQHVSTSSPKG